MDHRVIHPATRRSFVRPRLALAGWLAAACVGVPAWRAAGAATVVLRLTSPQTGALLEPGELVEWSVEAQASIGDSAGLALVLFDLVQSDGNPARIDLPPADGVPDAMAVFSPPLGIANPGEGGRSTGYVGVQRGAAGARNLMQIGGAQNTTGRVGAIQGQRTAVISGVAQGAFVLVARGTFTAPATSGSYAFRIANAIANTLVEVRPAPEATRVEPAHVVFGLESFSFTVEGGPPGCPFGCFTRGDCDGDGRAAGGVTDAVVLLSFNFLGGDAPPCLAACDVNGDGKVLGSVTDAIYLLSFSFLGGEAPPPPFPECGASSLPTDAILGCLESREECR